MNEAIARLLPGPLDIHAHVVPADLMRRLAGGARAGFGVEVTDGARRLMIGGEPMRMPVMPAMDNVEMRLKAMEEQGVAAQLVSPWVALCNYRLDEADGIWFAQTVNEAIADFCRAMPDRFAGIGAAPLQAPEKAAAMVAPMMGELGLLGVEINTTLGPETFLDDPSLDPFWAAAEEEGAFVFIHPSLGGTGKQFERYYLNNLIHNPLETTVAAAHLIFGGVMERFPRLKVCLAHGGGSLRSRPFPPRPADAGGNQGVDVRCGRRRLPPLLFRHRHAFRFGAEVSRRRGWRGACAPGQRLSFRHGRSGPGRHGETS